MTRWGNFVDLVRQAKPNKEIAYQLHLSEGTVRGS